MDFSRLKNPLAGISPKNPLAGMTLPKVDARNAMALVGGLGAGTAGAVSAAQEGDPAGTIALKALAAGGAGALAGRYGAPLAAAGVKAAGAELGRQAAGLGQRLKGTGLLTAAVGIPTVAGAGALAYQGARALNVPLDANKVPGFQNAQSVAVDQANAEYERFINEEMNMAYLNQAAMQPINPEQAGLSSNTMDARLGMQ
jgi:hypothetical protein